MLWSFYRDLSTGNTKTFESLVLSIFFGSVAGKFSHVVVQGEEKDHYDS